MQPVTCRLTSTQRTAYTASFDPVKVGMALARGALRAQTELQCRAMCLELHQKMQQKQEAIDNAAASLKFKAALRAARMADSEEGAAELEHGVQKLDEKVAAVAQKLQNLEKGIEDTQQLRRNSHQLLLDLQLFRQQISVQSAKSPEQAVRKISTPVIHPTASPASPEEAVTVIPKKSIQSIDNAPGPIQKFCTFCLYPLHVPFQSKVAKFLATLFAFTLFLPFTIIGCALALLKKG